MNIPRHLLYCLCIALGCATTPLHAQIDLLPAQIQELENARKADHDAKFGDALITDYHVFEELAAAIDSAVLRLLRNPALRLDSANEVATGNYGRNPSNGEAQTYYQMNHFVTVRSPEGDLEIISRDNIDGGCYHSFTHYFRLRDRKGRLRCGYFDMDVEEGYEVGYYQMDPLPSKGKSRKFLLMGQGATCGGTMHQIAKVISLEGNRIVIQENVFPEGAMLYVPCGRWDTLSLKYNPTLRQLSFKVASNDDGFYDTHGYLMTLNWKDENFVHTEEERRK